MKTRLWQLYVVYVAEEGRVGSGGSATEDNDNEAIGQDSRTAPETRAYH